MEGGAAQAVMSDGTSPFSIREAFRGATVLLTGATGYLGSLVLEQLLRCCSPQRVYVLIRARRGDSPEARLAKLLGSELFATLRREQPEQLSKVEVANGDVSEPCMGLQGDALQRVCDEVTMMIHCAASIALDPHIHDTLRHNYLCTRMVLEFASERLRRLRTFVHVSTTYTNGNLPAGSYVREQIYPLYLNGKEINHAELVDEFLSLSRSAAARRASELCTLWNYPNTYCLGKKLTEKLVASYHAAGLPIAILRPSLVSAIAGAPSPGYVGNLAGLGGQFLAYMLGFVNTHTLALPGTYKIMVVPGDIASSLVLATAAAQMQGVLVPAADASHTEQLLQRQRVAAFMGMTKLAAGSSGHLEAAAASSGPTTSSGRASSPRSPWSSGTETPPAGEVSNSSDCASQRSIGRASSDGGSDFTMGSASDAADRVASGSAGLLVVHADTSEYNPLMVHMLLDEAPNAMAHPKWKQSFKMPFSRYGPISADYKPNATVVWLSMLLLWLKLSVVAMFLRLFGQEKMAKKLIAFYKGWASINNVRISSWAVSHVLSSRNATTLEGMLSAEERSLFPLKFSCKWLPYLRSQFVCVGHRYLGVPVPPSSPDFLHEYVPQ